MRERREQVDQIVPVGPHLDAERALPRGRQHRVDIERNPDPVLEPEPLEPGRGQHDRVVQALVELAQAGVEVATQRLDSQIRPQRPQQHDAAQARRADHGALRQLLERGVAWRHQRVARVFAREHAGQRETVGQVHRHILERVHRDIGATVFERGLELFHEQALATHLAERAIEDLVAARGHAEQRDRMAPFLQQGLHVFRLPEGQTAFARGDHDVAQSHFPRMNKTRGMLACCAAATPIATVLPRHPRRYVEVKTNKMAPAPKRPKSDDQPLIDDIRLLGRILGDVIREQEGEATYALVEKIRTLSVAFRRDADHGADRSLKNLLKGLSAAETVRVIRAFTYFSHLANLAEDRHQIRRRTDIDRAGDSVEGSLQTALARIRKAGITPAAVVESLAQSYVSPVLTAHPTEVQRKSILDAERGIAQLITLRDEIRQRQQLFAGQKDALTPLELADNEHQLRTRVTQIWQTRLLRFSKLTVADEIENALSYYEATFLREIPRVYAELEQALGQDGIAPFLRMGQWIGGDRDGNPNVSAQTLEYALKRQSELVLRHYLTEVHYQGGELSLSATLVDVTVEMQALAERSPDANEHRHDEPDRRARTGV